ncbi:hypothetical protein [Calidifontibacillus erzurumensis]|uniref:Uncharacterized protein n=1 Tax=Calidifontibacillus erzurumensis TaxID=2741433 RepID=A0A8J8GFQ1_9BACI|nr:hypothetical protein [Calidifontibacillus erzurumensis]NSL51470.1 hypothetical protein [Calidifontibacillus erzurumensis]
MVFRLFIFLTGFGLAVAGGVTIIGYLNLIPIGYSFTDYLLFISKKIECYLLIIGLLFIYFSIYSPFEKNE